MAHFELSEPPVLLVGEVPSLGDLKPPLPLWRQWREVFVKVNADHVLNHFQIRKPPVPIVEIISAAGIRVELLSLGDDCSGVAKVIDNHAVIGVHPGDVGHRQRFTLAHELGHILLHKHQQQFRDKFNEPFTQDEVQANNFASELLMPAWMIWPLPRAQRIPESISQIFQVSKSAAQYRLERLGGVAFGK